MLVWTLLSEIVYLFLCTADFTGRGATLWADTWCVAAETRA
jgi:hypothetical protein